MLPCELPAWFPLWPLCTLTSNTLRTAEPQRWPCHASRLLAAAGGGSMWLSEGSQRNLGTLRWFLGVGAPSPACLPPLTSRSSSRHGSWRSAGRRRPAQESVRPVRRVSCSFRWEAAEPPLNSFPRVAWSLTFGDVGDPLLREPTCSHSVTNGLFWMPGEGRAGLAEREGKQSGHLAPGEPRWPHGETSWQTPGCIDKFLLQCRVWRCPCKPWR